MARTELVGLVMFGEAGTLLFIEWSRPVLIRLFARDLGTWVTSAKQALFFGYFLLLLSQKKRNARREGMEGFGCAAANPALRRQALSFNSSIAVRPRTAFLFLPLFRSHTKN